MKEVIELGLKNERLQQKLSTANDKLKKIEEYINKNNVYKYNEKGICIESPYIDWQCISRDISKIIKGED